MSTKTDSYKPPGPARFQQTAIDTVQKQGTSAIKGAGKTLAQMLHLTSSSAAATDAPRLNRKDIAEAMSRRDRYDNTTGVGGGKSEGGAPDDQFRSKMLSTCASPDLMKANTALSSADPEAATPHPLINIQTAQSQRETNASMKTRFRRSELSSKRTMGAEKGKKVMSLSSILNLEGSLVSSPKLSGGQLAGQNRLSQQQPGMGTRKSLFNFKRDIKSFKQTITMSRVREYLAGSGKLSENSNHFDVATAQPFREAAAAANHKSITQ